jgi:hypothetical protein
MHLFCLAFEGRAAPRGQEVISVEDHRLARAVAASVSDVSGGVRRNVEQREHAVECFRTVAFFTTDGH